MITSGRSDKAKEIFDALGIEWRGKAVQRVIVDIPCDGVVKVYVQKCVTAEDATAFAKAVVGSIPDVIVCDELIKFDGIKVNGD